jgi:hypothetical protein
LQPSGILVAHVGKYIYNAEVRSHFCNIASLTMSAVSSTF